MNELSSEGTKYELYINRSRPTQRRFQIFMTKHVVYKIRKKVTTTSKIYYTIRIRNTLENTLWAKNNKYVKRESLSVEVSSK